MRVLIIAKILTESSMQVSEKNNLAKMIGPVSNDRVMT